MCQLYDDYTYTTIQITKQTRDKLNRLKPYKRLTYEELISALVDLIPEGDDEGKYNPDFRMSILHSLLDTVHGRVYTTNEVKKQL